MNHEDESGLLLWLFCGGHYGMLVSGYQGCHALYSWIEILDLGVSMKHR